MLGDVKITVNILSSPWLECDGSATPQDSPLYALIGATLPDISYSTDSTTYIMSQ